jgi:hypothetical protein
MLEIIAAKPTDRSRAKVFPHKFALRLKPKPGYFVSKPRSPSARSATAASQSMVFIPQYSGCLLVLPMRLIGLGSLLSSERQFRLISHHVLIILIFFPKQNLWNSSPLASTKTARSSASRSKGPNTSPESEQISKWEPFGLWLQSQSTHRRHQRKRPSASLAPCVRRRRKVITLPNSPRPGNFCQG